MDLKVVQLMVLSIITLSTGYKYELTVLDEDVFSSCPDAPPGTLDISGVMDLAELSTSMDADGIAVSGNVTLTWDIQPKDRIQVIVSLLYFERGTWTPTVFSINSRDFCKDMYDKNNFWYKFWTQYISNDVKDKCLNVPGTKMIHEPFLLSLTANIIGLREGRYKANIMFKAFDSSGTERPTRICIEIQGEVFKV
nr:uncharacterized protein LOC108063552 [Drosophila takahashii]